jgi:hypothetical protein
MGVNHLGHHLLTTRLYDLLARYRATLLYFTAGFIILFLGFYACFPKQGIHLSQGVDISPIIISHLQYHCLSHAATFYPQEGSPTTTQYARTLLTLNCQSHATPLTRNHHQEEAQPPITLNCHSSASTNHLQPPTICNHQPFVTTNQLLPPTTHTECVQLWAGWGPQQGGECFLGRTQVLSPPRTRRGPPRLWLCQVSNTRTWTLARTVH